MNRLVYALQQIHPGVPRVSGDEPMTGGVSPFRDKCFLREQGYSPLETLRRFFNLRHNRGMAAPGERLRSAIPQRFDH